jgi:hyperosmotically inducible protein
MVKVTNKTNIKSVVFALLLGASLLVQSNAQAPDNTATNKRDQKSTEPTADQSKNNTSDRELTRQIRRNVVADKTLSVYGHNVKIIAQGGKVTLKGPVHTEEEKTTILNYAQKVAGEGNVVDQIAVKGDSK